MKRPSSLNHFQSGHVEVLLNSHARWLGQELIDRSGSFLEVAERLFKAPMVVASHNGAKDPIFTYGNELALALFGYSWEEFTQMPSRQSAEPLLQAEREALLVAVREQGFSDGYHGIRIGRHGRFEIKEARVWNLVDADDQPIGQAACFSSWRWIDTPVTGPRPP